MKIKNIDKKCRSTFKSDIGEMLFAFNPTWNQNHDPPWFFFVFTDLRQFLGFSWSEIPKPDSFSSSSLVFLLYSGSLTILASPRISRNFLHCESAAKPMYAYVALMCAQRHLGHLCKKSNKTMDQQSIFLIGAKRHL